jgi:hypothetical protein
MNVGGGIHCPYIHPVGGCHCHCPTTCGGSANSKMVGVGVGVILNLLGVTNNFLFLSIFVANEVAIPFVASYIDSTSWFVI